MVKLHPVIVFDSRERFFHYIGICNQTYRKDSESRSHYLALIAQYRQAKDYLKLLSDDSYLQLAYRTLEQWNMNQRGARLVPFSEFRGSVIQNRDGLATLSKYRLECLKWGILQRSILPSLRILFTDLRVMQSSARIVGVSKTLHCLLPDLVMPIDRSYTLGMLYLGTAYSSNVQKEFRLFAEVFEEYLKVAHDLSLSVTDVDGKAWNTSLPKMIDNAVIGFSMEVSEQVNKDGAVKSPV